MYYEILLQAEGEKRITYLKDVLDAFEPGLGDHVRQAFDEYVNIEGIDPEADIWALQEHIEQAGFRVWLITEPQSGGYHDVIYSREGQKQTGIQLLQTWAERAVKK